MIILKNLVAQTSVWANNLYKSKKKIYNIYSKIFAESTNLNIIEKFNKNCSKFDLGTFLMNEKNILENILNTQNTIFQNIWLKNIQNQNVARSQVWAYIFQ